MRRVKRQQRQQRQLPTRGHADDDSVQRTARPCRASRPVATCPSTGSVSAAQGQCNRRRRRCQTSQPLRPQGDHHAVQSHPRAQPATLAPSPRGRHRPGQLHNRRCHRRHRRRPTQSLRPPRSPHRPVTSTTSKPQRQPPCAPSAATSPVTAPPSTPAPARLLRPRSQQGEQHPRSRPAPRRPANGPRLTLRRSRGQQGPQPAREWLRAHGTD